MRYACPKMDKTVTHIYKIPKGEFMMRLGIGNKYNGLDFEIDAYDSSKNVTITIVVPALNKNGNYKAQP